jgi:uncharacterized protein (DUF433 family)
VTDRCDRCGGAASDVVVADVHTSGKALLQAADILVCVTASPDRAGRTIARLLADYPGCEAVAVLVSRGGRLPCRCCVDAVVERSLVPTTGGSR